MEDSKMSSSYKRVLIKITGDIFSPKQVSERDLNSCGCSTSSGANCCGEEKKNISLLEEIASLHKSGVEIGLVVGGGNFLRGKNSDIDRITADKIGMISTAINGLYLQNILSSLGCKSVILSSFAIDFLEKYNVEKARKYLTEEILIFVGGLGHPFFSTDTLGVLRALEIKAEVYLKATKVNGVYDKDPNKFADAKKFDIISCEDIILKDLQVMDLTAIILCKENKLPVCVFDIFKNGNLKRVINRENVGTLVN